MTTSTGEPRLHRFDAIAFVENFPLKDLASVFPGARVAPHELAFAIPSGGDLFAYPFGAIVFHDVPRPEREAQLAKLRGVHPRLTTETSREDFVVREATGARLGVEEGTLTVDRLTPARASVVALIVAQSVAMEYYERILDHLAIRTHALAERLRERGDVSFRTRPLHRFIGEAIGIRTEVLSVLHLLDKPDATWDDPGMDRIYDDLRAEFDLGDRYDALGQKLRGVQEALELVLGVARDRRFLFLEVAIGLLILVELVLALVA